MKVSEFNTEVLSKNDLQSIEGGGGIGKIVWDIVKERVIDYVIDEVADGFSRGMESDCTDICSA